MARISITTHKEDGTVEVTERDMTVDELAAIAVEEPVPVPVSVTPRQLFRALDQMGLLAAVLTWVASADQPTKIDFEKATEYRRDHPMWGVGAAALGKTSADIDALFTLAATL